METHLLLHSFESSIKILSNMTLHVTLLQMTAENFQSRKFQSILSNKCFSLATPDLHTRHQAWLN